MVTSVPSGLTVTAPRIVPVRAYEKPASGGLGGRSALGGLAIDDESFPSPWARWVLPAHPSTASRTTPRTATDTGASYRDGLSPRDTFGATMLIDVPEWRRDILQEHLEELEALWIRRARAIRSPDADAVALRRIDARMDAHVDAL